MCLEPRTLAGGLVPQQVASSMGGSILVAGGPAGPGFPGLSAPPTGPEGAGRLPAAKAQARLGRLYTHLPRPSPPKPGHICLPAGGMLCTVHRGPRLSLTSEKGAPKDVSTSFRWGQAFRGRSAQDGLW